MDMQNGNSDSRQGEQEARPEETVSVDLHCHSDASDGSYAPQLVADLMAREGIKYGALTDHHTTAGLPRFHEAAERQGISDITGAEIHAEFGELEIHLLAYGFDPENGVIRYAFEDVLGIREVIDRIHEAGGVAILAHPLEYGWSEESFERNLEHLVQAGLDGIEAFYSPYPPAEQERLAAIADRYAIVTTAGSDFHGTQNGSPRPGSYMPVRRWKRFREALGSHARNGLPASSTPSAGNVDPRTRLSTVDWRRLALRVFVPAMLVIGFFVTLLFAVLIPNVEELLLDQRRLMTSEQTNTAWSILSDYHREVDEGSMELEEAQNAAAERIRRLRYGPERKDYFWIQDMEPRMVMHPYREDLEGQDLSGIRDPDGVRLFVEFVETVRADDTGFVRYVWQWQDDPDRMEPKESYVRRFEPWGWIIGTGLYVEDVEESIDAMTRRMVDISFIVIVLSAVLLGIIAYQSLRGERRRSAAERELRLSHERYRALVESSASGTLLLIDGRCTYANGTVLDMLGYTATELAFLDLHDIIGAQQSRDSREHLERIAAGQEAPAPFDARLKCKNGRDLPILLSANPVFYSGRQGVLLSIQDLTRHRANQGEVERERLISQLQTSLLFLTEPVRDSMSSPVSCSLDTPVAEAIRVMNRQEVDALTVVGPEHQLIGIVTDHDIRARLVGAGLDTRTPVSQIMTAPVVTVDESAPVFEAVMREHEHAVGHLAVLDGNGDLVGMTRSSRMLRPDQYSPVVLTRQADSAETIDDLAACHERLPSLIGSLVDNGALPQNICQVTTSLSDTIAKRIVDLTIEELGPPPARFAFIALGSEARKEQTLATDQDNALIYEDQSEQDEEARRYFSRFGELVCDRLNQAGYRYCEGENMARNPRWNQPLCRWKQYFHDWIREPDEQALARCNVFFDCRCIYGDQTLLDELWEEIGVAQEAHPGFLSHMALNTLNYRPPVGLFGKIVTRHAGEARHTFSVKEAMLPVSNFARLYALRHHLEETNTFERLEQLHSDGILPDDGYRAISQTYGYLMQLRFRRQVDRLKAGLPADNSLDPGSLTEIETATLKNTFSQISLIQKKVGYDFRVSI